MTWNAWLAAGGALLAVSAVLVAWAAWDEIERHREVRRRGLHSLRDAREATRRMTGRRKS